MKYNIIVCILMAASVLAGPVLAEPPSFRGITIGDSPEEVKKTIKTAAPGAEFERDGQYLRAMNAGEKLDTLVVTFSVDEEVMIVEARLAYPALDLVEEMIEIYGEPEWAPGLRRPHPSLKGHPHWSLQENHYFLTLFVNQDYTNVLLRDAVRTREDIERQKESKSRQKP